VAPERRENGGKDEAGKPCIAGVKRCQGSPVRWYMTIIPELRRQRQKDLEFVDSLGYKMSLRPSWAIC
jgi:hypothetical protein